MPPIAQRAFCNILGAARYRYGSGAGPLFRLEYVSDHTARERVFQVVPRHATTLIYVHLVINL